MLRVHTLLHGTPHIFDMGKSKNRPLITSMSMSLKSGTVITRGEECHACGMHCRLGKNGHLHGEIILYKNA